jgi:hypothetical protein
VATAVWCVVCPDLAGGGTVAQRSTQRRLWFVKRVRRARQISTWHVERVDATCSTAARVRSGGLIDGVGSGRVRQRERHRAPQPEGDNHGDHDGRRSVRRPEPYRAG